MKAISAIFCVFCALLLSPINNTPICYAGAEEFENGDPEAWREWNQTIQDYMDHMRLVQEQGRITAASANKGLDDAAKKADKKLHDQILTETDVRLSVIIKELGAMEVPSTLKGFHAAVTESYANRKKACEEALKNDYKAGTKSGDLSIRAEIRAMEEMRKASLVNGAPRHVLDEMDASLADYRKYLSVKDKTGPA